MSVCICKECERFVDTDYEEGFFVDVDKFTTDFYCDNCADRLGLLEEEE